MVPANNATFFEIAHLLLPYTQNYHIQPQKIMTTNKNSPLVVALATTILIVMGLLLNLVTAFFPLCLWALQPPASAWYYALPVVLVQATHLYLLWTDPGHVAAYRFLTLPIRKALQPVVMFLIKEDAVKEKEDVSFLRLDEIGTSSSGNLV